MILPPLLAGSALNQLADPEGIFVDGQGDLNIADDVNHRVVKWTPGVHKERL
jgi:hypothetical protein